jgi:hypothetical protein
MAAYLRTAEGAIPWRLAHKCCQLLVQATGLSFYDQLHAGPLCIPLGCTTFTPAAVALLVVDQPPECDQ